MKSLLTSLTCAAFLVCATPAIAEEKAHNPRLQVANEQAYVHRFTSSSYR